MGNSERVARKHYLQVTQEHFKAAVSSKAALHLRSRQTSKEIADDPEALMECELDVSGARIRVQRRGG